MSQSGAERHEELDDRLLIRAFPEPGPRARNAFRELYLAANGGPEQQRHVGNPENLQRPWDPATCTDPPLRAEVWAWLEQVVAWLNHEYTWDLDAMIPSCWSQHPHLVHEIAVLADRRRVAGTALTSDGLEEWHRSVLPQFTDRMRARLGHHCDEGHQPWPARSRHLRHTGDEHETGSRHRDYAGDVQALLDARRTRREQGSALERPRLSVVDLHTGELSDPPADDP
jgi:hypothetical protein